jgi:HEAT repeat protein
MAKLFMLLLSVHCQSQILQSTGDLIDRLRSKEPSIRVNAAKEVAKLGDKAPREAIDQLVKSLDDPDYDVQWYAIQALKAIGRDSEKAIGGLIKILSRNDATSWDAELALIHIGRPVVKPIIKVLKSGKMRSRHIGLYNILSRLRTEAKEAIPVLEDGLTAKDADERLFAARAIIEIDPGQKSVEGVLTASLKSNERRVRLIAAEALARSTFFKTKEALTVLLEILADDKTKINDYNKATVAIAYFGPAGKEALPVLTKHLQRWRKAIPAWGVYIAGAIIKIDERNKDAKVFLEAHADVLESVARSPTSDRLFSNFAKDILDNVLEKKKTKGGR